VGNREVVDTAWPPVIRRPPGVGSGRSRRRAGRGAPRPTGRTAVASDRRDETRVRDAARGVAPVACAATTGWRAGEGHCRRLTLPRRNLLHPLKLVAMAEHDQRAPGLEQG